MSMLLYVCGTYAPGAFAGSELSAHTLLRRLGAQEGVEVAVVTDAKYTGGHGLERSFEGVRMLGADHARRAEAIEAAARELSPTAILTQLLWSDVAIDVGEALGIPTILRIATVPTSIDLSRPTALVASSRYAQQWIRDEWKRESYRIRPSIDLARVRASEGDRRPRFITMFNPVHEKGGAVFREIARALPDREFAVVPGWHSLRDSSGSFDRELLERAWGSQEAQSDRLVRLRALWLRGLRALPYRIRRRLGATELYPREVDFSDCPNVTVLAPRADVASIYAQTRLLLVPSQWQETFGRVAIEAFANGIPVIASRVGGLKEHVGEGGVLVDDRADVDAWVRAIESLDDEEAEERARGRALESAERHERLDHSARRYRSLIERVGDARRGWTRTDRAGPARPRVRILIPYFGAWPPWMECFLESCRANPGVEWRLLTDCGPLPVEPPPNVLRVDLALEDFLARARERLGIDVRWNEPYKLCDLRLGLGAICREHRADCDFLGWGDLDVVYGDLESFLGPELTDRDIVSFCADHLSGHLCLLRNDDRVLDSYHDLADWRERMEATEYTHLDELPVESVPLEYRLLAAESFNTPLSPKIRWTDGTFDFPESWTWRDGRLTNDKDGAREFPYLHFMHWKGGAWPRECGNAQWERLDRIVRVEPGRAREGFRVDASGIGPLRGTG